VTEQPPYEGIVLGSTSSTTNDTKIGLISVSMAYPIFSICTFGLTFPAGIKYFVSSSFLGGSQIIVIVAPGVKVVIGQVTPLIVIWTRS